MIQTRDQQFLISYNLWSGSWLAWATDTAAAYCMTDWLTHSLTRLITRAGSSPKILRGMHCPINPFITESILSVLRNRQKYELRKLPYWFWSSSQIRRKNSVTLQFFSDIWKCFQLAFECGGGQQVNLGGTCSPRPNVELLLTLWVHGCFVWCTPLANVWRASRYSVPWQTCIAGDVVAKYRNHARQVTPAALRNNNYKLYNEFIKHMFLLLHRLTRN